MRGPGRFIGGILAGIGIAYLLDPERGARRRAEVRDKAASVGRRLAKDFDATTRDLRSRAKDTAAELRAKFREELDDTLDDVPALQGKESRES
jgi:broad specificity phosphatase PhoE